ncbi:hypothetical protein ACLI09_01830 [Flavobacterium sp. RHBU_24]|uniref:hypothetical protein n=1 Tax=Flavobacterium sp. RHBU_24 TaxID=3391185 RepID=UPI003984D5B1
MRIVRTYSLEWLDSLVSVTLNPDKPFLSKLDKDTIGALLEKVPLEALQVQTELTLQIFAVDKESKVRHIVGKYHVTFNALAESILSYRDHPSFRADSMQALVEIIAASLNELCQFIEKRFAAYLTTLQNPFPISTASKIEKESTESRSKVLCMLSADQLALLLRAADESQLVKARSMNAVFKYIIPHLSTPNKADLSPNAVRSKAYHPEEADREAAIDALQKLIKKIQSY